MDIKKSIQSLMDEPNVSLYEKAQLIETLISEMLSRYMQDRGKKYIEKYRIGESEWDGYVPGGFDDYKGDVAIDIRVTSNMLIPTKIDFIIGRTSAQHNKVQHLIFVITVELPFHYREQIESRKKGVELNVVVWDIDNLVSIFKKYPDLYEKTYFKLRALYIKRLTTKALNPNRKSYIEKRHVFVRKLQDKYDDDDLVLFLGAGASVDAGIATWDNLISNLFVTLIDKRLHEKEIEIEQELKPELVEQIQAQYENMPLLQARFLRNWMGNDFESAIQEILYKNAKNSSPLIDSIGKLCVPKRGKIGVRAIINYNFDDLIENTLEASNQEFHSVYSDSVIVPADKIGIYHVHGFLPRNPKDYQKLSHSSLVFSEDRYHELMMDPYHWANMVQLNYLLNHTCLFVGLSMTDPNLRRL